MFGSERQVIGWIQKHIDCGCQRPTTAMSQNHDKLQASAQVVHGIFQTAQDLCTQTIASHANYKELVWSFVEDQLDRDAGVRTAENGCERALFWQLCVARLKA